MALRVNSSPASGVPDEIIRAIASCNSQFPERWERDWLASLIASQQLDDWELKLTSEDGITRRGTLSGIANQHNSTSVCTSLLALRDTWNL